MQQESRTPEVARVYWQCRRGMRELDLLLKNYLDHPRGYCLLDAKGRAAMETLLDYPDQLLLEVLLGRQIPADREVADVVNRIRASTAPDS